jgi:NAD+ kinase
VIRRVGIVVKRGLSAATPHLRTLIEWLAARDIEALVDEDTGELLDGASASVATRDELARTADLIVVLGGDGTLLGVADHIGESNRRVPLIGVNFGRLGFLTEVTLPEMIPALEAAVAGRAHVHDRSMLSARTRLGGRPERRHIVLNDIVVTKGSISRLIYLSVYIDAVFVTNVKADGLIIASPTGSTAYNLAAGGPIVHPGVDALLVTPIAPHTLGNRPIVIPGRCTVSIRAAENASHDPMYLTLDGQSGFEFHHSDEVIVTRADRTLTLVASPSRGYYDTLREKLHWGER